MAQMFEFKKVTVGPRALTARVELAPNAPVMTSEDPDAVDLILELLPGLSDHVCLGDAAPTFGEVIRDTELAHLLEHVSVELLAQSNIAGDIARGQTREVGERAYEIVLGCPDDVLVAGAISSAAWILQWAFSGGGEPEPNIEATVGGLVALVEDLVAAEAEAQAQIEAQAEEEAADFAEPDFDDDSVEDAAEASDEALEDDADLAETEDTGDLSADDALDEEPEDSPASKNDGWDMDNVPRPHLVR